MIEKINAMNMFWKNHHRTESLITAMDKIYAYNRIYQDKQFSKNIEFGKIVGKSQDEELQKINISCGEHAIISLATTFETYYKSLLQQLLHDYPYYFLSRHTMISDLIRELIEDEKSFSYEKIETKLNMRNRFNYYEFFENYSIVFLTTDEKKFIELIFLKRNNYVHDAGAKTNKTKYGSKRTILPETELMVSTDAKVLRTKFKKMIPKINDKVIKILSNKR